MTARTFGKAERLHSKKLIQELFSKGSSFYLYPFKVLVLANPNTEIKVHQVLFSASKRNFKKASDRNLIKRRGKEAYRLQKITLSNTQSLIIAFLYTSKELLSYELIHSAIGQALKKMEQKYVQR